MTTDSWWLEPNEQPLWSGRPVVLRFVRKRLGANFILGVPVFGLFLIAYFNWADGKFVTFLQIALCVLGASLLYLAAKTVWLANQTIYVLSPRRALILIGHESTSIWIRDLQSIRVRQSRDGLGDIIFKETTIQGSESQWIREEGFFSIRDVANVEKLVHDLIGAVSSAAPPVKVSHDT